MMRHRQHAAEGFGAANSQSYGDLHPYLGTKLGGIGISMVLPRMPHC